MTQIEDQPTDTLEPFEESFPSSHKIHDRVEWNGHVLHVPKRRIHLSNDDDPVDVYDTSGPQGIDPREGLPKRREAWIAARAVLAANERHHGPDDPRTEDARREVRRLGLREHIQRVVDEAPPLTAEQRSELAALLLVGGGTR